MECLATLTFFNAGIFNPVKSHDFYSVCPWITLIPSLGFLEPYPVYSALLTALAVVCNLKNHKHLSIKTYVMTFQFEVFIPVR